MCFFPRNNGQDSSAGLAMKYKCSSASTCHKWSDNGVFCIFSLGNVLRATTACTFSTSQLPKSGPTMMCFVHFDLEMCFAPQRRALFDISTSKSGPSNGVFCTFSLGNVLFAPQRRALFRHLNFQKWSDNGVFCTFSLGNVLRATTACTFSTSQLPKVVRAWCFLYIFTWKCASRHNGVHFFDISTSKSGPTMVCFVHFDLDMCFAPQRRALFRHLNFQEWSEHGVFCTFSLGNVASRHNGVHFFDISTSKSGPTMVCFVHFDLEMVLRATTACTFSTSQLLKVVRHWCVLYILTWKCASRHNGISTSKSGPSMVCFVHFHLEMCFAPQRRALFRHLNFQKWSDNGVFCTF